MKIDKNKVIIKPPIYIYEDSDCEDYPKSKPVVKTHVIRLAVFCVVLVIFVGSIVWKIANG